MAERHAADAQQTRARRARRSPGRPPRRTAAAAHDLLGRARPAAAASLGRLDVLDDPAVGAVVAGAPPRTRSAGARARALVRTRSIGVISWSIVRIGLIFSAMPSHAEAAPIRPPRRRYSSVSTANHIFRSARAASARRSTSSTSAPERGGLARAASTIRPRPPQPLSRVDHRRPVPASAPSCSLAWRAASTVPEIAARDVDRDDVVPRLRAAAGRRPGSRRSRAGRWWAAGRRSAGGRRTAP